ncbi:proteasome endopeptidase complex, beta component Threonine peptidase. MEROPS family T01A [Halobiforma haloterrestris]|uniref:proteasome endopeptidase complex n=1 Tax=Natronobacterium haloterrestre TaxID=148448 RepID=A0A1I1IN73_NATHA|nr:proteasome subunit alpha [Halobiforma haloterrestris]SFC37381.1 proteasome endopeptidase complex, beta component Threonine peptidase. MEROPS family T01A [Halobiforma haloterrestris]
MRRTTDDRFRPGREPESISPATDGFQAPLGEGTADDSSRIVETGTTTVGVVGPNGVVLAADRRASLGGRFVTSKRARKIEPVADRTALTFSGSVGEAQTFVRQLRSERRLYELRGERAASVETIATVAGDLIQQGPYRALELVLAGVDDEPSLYQIGRGGGVMRADYAASGSGMQLAYGNLEDAYEPDLPLSALREAAAVAVHSATERDTASGDGATLATITDDGIDLETFDTPNAAVAATTEEVA